jgi:ribonucleoside-diphosphate reductase alpha chain
MQAAFQEFTDSAISKTTNFAHTATVADVRAIYELAYDKRCKGVTVYRDGSRDAQVLSTGATEKAAELRKSGEAPKEVEDSRREMGALRGDIAEKDAEIARLKKTLYELEAENLQRRTKRSRPDVLRGTTIRKETPLGVMFVNVTEDEKGQPFEVFINLGKAGGSAMADAEAMGRLISLALRSGIPLHSVHRQLRGISSDRAVGLGPNKVLSVPDAVGSALEEWMRFKQGVQQDLLATTAENQIPSVQRTTTPMQVGAMQPQLDFSANASSAAQYGACQDCGSQLEFAEGCAKCHVCGFSECG